MDEFQKAFYALVGPNVAGVLGAFVVVLIIIPYVYKAWETWLDARSGQRLREYEKGRYEILKLRYEIEAIRKDHGLPEIIEPVQLSGHKAESPTPPQAAIAGPLDLPMPERARVQAQTQLQVSRPKLVFAIIQLIVFCILAIAASLGAFVALLGGIILNKDYATGSVMLAVCLALLLASFFVIRRSSHKLAGRRLIPKNG